MIYIAIAFGIGVGVGVIISKAFHLRTQRQLEEQVINCQKMIYDLTTQKFASDNLYDDYDTAVRFTPPIMSHRPLKRRLRWTKPWCRTSRRIQLPTISLWTV